MQEIEVRQIRADTSRLLAFGFASEGEGYVYKCEIPDIQMTAIVKIEDNKLYTELRDTFSGEEYVLHRVPSAVGSFVGTVRELHQALVDRVIEECYVADLFKRRQSLSVIEYARQKYCHEPDYPFGDENAILRRQDTGKWYAALLNVARSSLGLQGEGREEVLNLKAPPDTVQQLLHKDGILPAYHMNKKHWYTVILDGTVSDEELFELIDESYRSVKK